MKPGVPLGTMIVEISLRPSRSPVTAVTVTKRVMAVPELVMNCFEPLITHSPPSRRAVVRVAPASDPASGSVSPKPASARPASRSGSSSLLLLLGAEAEDRHRAEAHAGLEGDRERLVDAPERLDREAQREVVAALAAVLLGERQPEQTELAHLRDDVERQRVGAVGLVGTRRDDLVGEFAHHAGELALVLGQVVGVHVSRSSLLGRESSRQSAVRAATTWARAWSRRTCSPTATSSVTMPSWGAVTRVLHLHRLDGDDAVARADPAPSATWTATTAPGIGARSSGSVPRRRGRPLRRGASPSPHVG